LESRALISIKNLNKFIHRVCLVKVIVAGTGDGAGAGAGDGDYKKRLFL
jgi:hypothetical protein